MIGHLYCVNEKELESFFLNHLNFNAAYEF